MCTCLVLSLLFPTPSVLFAPCASNTVAASVVIVNEDA